MTARSAPGIERAAQQAHAAIQRGDFDSAIEHFGERLRLDAGSAEAHSDLASAYRFAWRLEEAIEHYERALAISPSYAVALHNLGVTQLDAGRPEAALTALLRALELRPGHVDTILSLIHAYRRLERLGEAAPLLAVLEERARKRPRDNESATQLALAYAQLDRFAEAISTLETVVERAPRGFDGLRFLGLLLIEEGRYDEALTRFEQALRVSPESGEVRFYRAIEMLRAGRFREGFAEYEWRWRNPLFTSPRRQLDQPAWDGSPAPAATLLLQTEQGLGDAIQFVRFAARARELVGRVVLECEPELVRLFSGVAGVDEVRARGDTAPSVDLQASLMSLPHLLGSAPGSFGTPVPYLAAAAGAVPGAGTAAHRVGLVWAGSRGHVNDANRSCSLELFRGLTGRADVEFVSLQKGQAAADLASFSGTRIHDGVRAASDLFDTAAVIAALDLVITVDTAVAHLAGALGKPVWVLLPFDADWRWMTGRNDSPWYPTMRLFRQPRRGDWTTVLADVAAALHSFISPPEATPMPSTPDLQHVPDRRDFAAAVQAHQQQRLPEAETLYRRAIAAEPTLAEAHNNLGALLAQLGRTREAEALFRAAIALSPDYGEAHNNLGLIQAGRGERAEAARCFEHATRSDGSRVEWWNNLGNVYLEMLRVQDALTAYDRAVAADPGYVFAINNRGVALRGLARYDEAIEALLEAHRIDPGYVEAINNLGLVHRDRGDAEAALECQRRALKLAPGNLDVQLNYGITLQEFGDHEGARRVASEVLALSPGSSDALDIFGHCAYEEGRLDEAFSYFTRATELNPEDVNAQWNLALLRLHRGDFAEGLPAYEWRKRLVVFVPNTRASERPHWDGSPLDGKRVLIFSEQGIGDAIQFVRYAEGLKERGAGKVYVECAEGVKKLLRTARGVDGVVAKGEPLPPHDVHVYVMSLPGLMGTTVETIPAPIPYLAAEPTELSERVRSGSGLKVGIVWGGNPEFKRDARRSLHFSAIEHLAAIPGVQLYSLQVGTPAAQLAESRYRDRIVDLGAEVARRGRDMTETAAVIAELDLVISTCTSVPHLSGALGKPTWVMLPFVADWRWLLERDDTPWYPSTRLFRQPRLDDWASVVAEVTSELRRLAGAPAPTSAAASAPLAIAPELQAFLSDQLRTGDVFLDVGGGDDGAAITAATLADRTVRVVAVAPEPEAAERLLGIAASTPTTGTIEVVTADPDAAPVDDLAFRALRMTRGNAFLRVAAPGGLSNVLPRASRLMASGRLAALIWPYRAGNHADAITAGGLAALGFAHFTVGAGENGPEMYAFDPSESDALIFTLSLDYLAASLADQQESEAPREPRAAELVGSDPSSPPAGKPLTVAFDWEISSHSGWGVYGLNLALHSLRTGRALPVPLTRPHLDGLDPLQRRLLEPALDGKSRPEAADLVLRALGNGLAGAGGDSLAGQSEVGVVFFEDTALDAAALERGRRFDRIVAGSTWNGDVLRGYGLENVEVSLQGIDPTVFYPAPRSGWLGDRFVVFSGGKLEYRKGQDIVIAAFREFHRRHPDALLMVAWHNHWPQTMAEVPLRGLVRGVPRVDRQGRLDLGSWLVQNGIPESAFVDLGLAPNSQMGRLVREADVALFPNRCEGGTNLVAMECMASGVPTVLSANTGHLDLVRESDCYGLFTQDSAAASRHFRGVDGWGESSVEEIVSVLEQVYTDREEAARRARSGAERMQGFAWSHRIDHLLGCLADLASIPSI